MNYLLDTHIFIWTRLEPQKLSAKQRQVISGTAQKFISTTTLWEISLKFGLGKLKLGRHTPEQFIDSAIVTGFQILAPEPATFTSFYQLPPILKHKDPFDRMLIWQAIQQNLVLLSSDEAMPNYKIHGLKLAK